MTISNILSIFYIYINKHNKEKTEKMTMRDEYDFSNAVKNPYAKAGKTVVTIRLDTDVIEYFKTLAANINLPYQTLINSYLLDCVKTKKMPTISWK